ncbi:hypothetical protein BX667DRAFT_224336 [Coemansia mojavensis]|nr:hypothetical protein BX667DRAFT_224336 [Coemansia mojavensis]
MVFHQEVKDKYDAILRGEVSPKDWDADIGDDDQVYTAALIKYPKFVEELEDEGCWRGIVEFVNLIYHNKLPTKNPPLSLRCINLRGLPIPSREVVQKLYESDDYGAPLHGWSWKYFAYEWNERGKYHLPFFRKYSRSWVNKTFDWTCDMDLLFVFDMFYDIDRDCLGMPDSAEFVLRLESSGVIEHVLDDLPEDLRKSCDFLHRREEDRTMFCNHEHPLEESEPIEVVSDTVVAWSGNGEW